MGDGARGSSELASLLAAGGPSTVADGADATQGTTTDAAVITDATGTISAKLRGTVALLAGVLRVGGNVASGASDSGNPVKVGGKYNSTLPTLANGQRGDFQLGARGQVATELFVSNVEQFIGGSQLNFDSLSAGNYGLVSLAAGMNFNEVGWDRQRGTIAAALLASASRTTTQTGADITNYNHRGIKVIVDMTVVGTGSVTVAIQGKSAVGTYYPILTGAAVTTNVTNVYTVFPGATAAANSVANDALPRTFRIVITANNANAATYSVDYELIL